MITQNTTLTLETSVAGESLVIELLPEGRLSIALWQRDGRGRRFTTRSCRLADPADVEDLGKRLAQHAGPFVGDAALSSRVLEGRSVDELELSVRATHCLANAGIRTLGDLVKRTDAELRKIKNSGAKVVKEIDEVLANIGLRRESAGQPR